MVGSIRSLGRRPRHLGRHRRRHPRRRLHRPPVGGECHGPAGRRGAGASRRAGIGRVGNWWNQELFGKPTSLPWGLEIDPVRRPDKYLFNETFHPTFLYEALWNLLAAGCCSFSTVASAFARRRSSPSTLCSTRLSLLSRDAPDRSVARDRGLRVNAWVSGVLFVLSLGFFIWWQLLRGGRRRRREPKARATADDGRPTWPRPTTPLASGST